MPLPRREIDPTDGPFTATLGAFERLGVRPAPVQVATIAEARRWAETVGMEAGAVWCKITNRDGKEVALHTRASSWGTQQTWSRGRV